MLQSRAAVPKRLWWQTNERTGIILPPGGLAKRGSDQLKGTFNLMFIPSARHPFKVAGSVYLNVRTNIPKPPYIRFPINMSAHVIQYIC